MEIFVGKWCFLILFISDEYRTEQIVVVQANIDEPFENRDERWNFNHWPSTVWVLSVSAVYAQKKLIEIGVINLS